MNVPLSHIRYSSAITPLAFQCGFASGYLTHVNGREIYCVEVECRARGDAACRMIGKPREAWGDALASELPYYAKAGLDAALARVGKELARTERRLRERRSELARFRAEPEDDGVTARSPAMVRLLELAHRVAQVRAGLHPRGPGRARWQPGPGGGPPRDRAGDAVPQAGAVRRRALTWLRAGGPTVRG